MGLQLHQLVDRPTEVVGKLAVGDTVDLPVQEAQGPISSLVLLRLQPPAVPGDMIDLDSPPRRDVGTVRMNPDSIRQADRVLSDEWADTSCFQRGEHAQLET